MTELIDYIDKQIKACIPEVRQFGLCHQLEGDNEIYPATVSQNAVKAIPDDRYLITTYHRLINGQYQPREDLSFGRRVVPQNNQRVRTVVFIKLGQSQSRIDDVVNAMPDDFQVAGYQFVSASKPNILNDRGAIWDDEYTGAYRDKYQMKFHVYALEFDLDYVKCKTC